MPPSAVAPGAATTAELTPEGQTAVRFAVAGVRRDNGVSESWPSDEVTLPTGAVRALRVRRLAVGRSVALGGAAAVAMCLVGRNLGGGTTDGGRGGETVPGK